MAVQLRINKTKNVGKSVWWCGQKLCSPLPPIGLWTGNARNQYSYFFLHILCCITADMYYWFKALKVTLSIMTLSEI